MQNGVVINFEKIGPDPPAPTEKIDDLLKDELSKDLEYTQEIPALSDKSQNLANSIQNTSWYSCRKMIYVPRSTQKGYPLGRIHLHSNFYFYIFCVF